MSGEGMIDNRHPLDTSTLGPIRVEPNAIAERARVVREALEHLRCRSGDYYEERALRFVISAASDDTLAKLGRLVK
jgi:hypothetical protein